MGLRMLCSQAAQFAGFALGGALVTALGPRAVLGLDAGTFVVSVLLIALFAPRETPKRSARAREAPATSTPEKKDGPARMLWRDTRVRALVGLSALAGFFIAPEGLAVPFAERWSSSPGRAGLLLSAIPLGSAVGVYVLVRRVAAGRRMAVAGLMAVLCGLPLVASAAVGSYPVAVACWLASGAFAAYQVEVLTQIVQSVPDVFRAGAIGLCNAVLLGMQGLGLTAFGKVADVFTPGQAVAAAGALGALGAMCLVVYLRGRPASVPV
jgi:hypothetical protein